MRTKTSKIEVPIWGAEIKLVITSDPTSYKHRIGGKEEREYDGDNDDIAEAWFLHDDPDTKNYILILEHNADGHLVVHESIHAALMILDTCGQNYSSKNDEALTYLASFIYEQIVKRLKR